MTGRSARPGPGRDRATYGDVGRIVLPHRDRIGDDATREEIQAAHDAIGAEEPRRRYARVQDADGHQWERGNTRWTCLSPVNGRDVTQAGRLPWSYLVAEYGPITVLDENLPAPKPAKRATPAVGDSATAIKSRVRALAKELEDEADQLTMQSMTLGAPTGDLAELDARGRRSAAMTGRANDLRELAVRIRGAVKG